MADNFKALIESLKADNQDTREELRDTSNEQVESINTLHKSLLSMSQKQLDALESSFNLMQEDMRDRAREERLRGGVNPAESTSTRDGGIGFNIGKDFVEGTSVFFAGLGSLGGIMASFGALAGTIAGLTGYEGQMLKGIKTKTTELGNAIMKSLFGEKIALPDGGEAREGGLIKRMSDAVDALAESARQRFYKAVGLGVDGKPVVRTSDTVKAIYNLPKTIDDLISTSITRIDEFFAPLKTRIAEIETSFKNFTTKITTSLDNALTPVKNLSTKLDEMLTPVKDLSTKVTAFFTEGAGATVTRTAKSLFTGTLDTGLSWMGKLLGWMGDLATGVGGFFAGAGAGVFEKIKPIFESDGAIGKLLGNIGKILKPLGFIFAAADAITAFDETEGSIARKFTAGVGAFVGDFVGGLLDLIKDIGSWALGKLGFKGAEEKLDSFSFEQLINDFTLKAYDYVAGVLETVGGFLSNLPDQISTSVQSFWTNLKADFEINMLKVKDFFIGLPDRLLASIVNMLGKASITIPDNAVTDFLGIAGAGFSLIGQDTIDAANAAVRNAQNNQAAEIAAINDRRQAQLLAIEERAKQVQAQQPIVVNNVDNSNRSVNTTVGGDSNTAVAVGGSSNSLSNGIPAGAMPF